MGGLAFRLYRRPAALLAAQLMAESGFDPYAVSPAGAQGIAQFMPGTAASYGLHDPFDPEAAIDAQAQMMSGLLRHFGSVRLALAAYNAGSGAVDACDCVPAYPETVAYVARILALLDGSGASRSERGTGRAMPEENVEIVRRYFVHLDQLLAHYWANPVPISQYPLLEEAFNAIAPEAEWKPPFMGKPVRGRDAWLALVSGWLAAADDWRIKVEDV